MWMHLITEGTTHLFADDTAKLSILPFKQVIKYPGQQWQYSTASLNEVDASQRVRKLLTEGGADL
jgi:hypothetical protein